MNISITKTGIYGNNPAINSTAVSIRPIPLLSSILLALGITACSGDGGGISTTPVSIEEAGEFTLLDERSGRVSEPVIELDIPAGDGITASCSTEEWDESDVRELTNVVGLDLNGTTLYPGALLQGTYYENGLYVPITVPRSTGTIYMTGLNLDPGAQYFADNVEMTGANVNQAIKNIINDNGVVGTTANSSYQEDTAYSYENMLFTMGIDARYGLNDMSADLSIDNTKSRNYAFLKFTQVFYDIVYEDPELATTVFRDGAQFSDPEGQIAPGNPPLYVSKVSYGRMVFFVAESTHDSSEVEAALSAAVRGGLASGTVESGLTYQEVMERTKVYYYAIGGAADLALAPIKSATQAEMFAAVKNFIADRKSANFTAENPGAPISYTLNYLKDRSPARMSYTVNYNKKDCEFYRSTGQAIGERITLEFHTVNIPDDCDPGFVNGAGEIFGRFDVIYYDRDGDTPTQRTKRVITLSETEINNGENINLWTLKKPFTFNHYYGDIFEISATLDDSDAGESSANEKVGNWNANRNDFSQYFGPSLEGAKRYTRTATDNCRDNQPVLTIDIVKEEELF